MRMLVLPSLIAVVATPALAKDRLCLLLEGIGEVCYNRDVIQ